MARTMKAGDTWPPLRGQASDASGVLDLSTAVSLDVVLTSGTHQITGTATPIQPPIVDEEGTWNWEYNWADGDTDNPGDYTVELKVVWSLGPPPERQTFPNTGSETLTIEAT